MLGEINVFPKGIGHLSFLCKYLLVPAIILGTLHTFSLILTLILGGWYNSCLVVEASEDH